MIEEKIIQITSGKGPDECERAVFLVYNKFKKECNKLELQIEVIEFVNGKQEDTYFSVLFKLKGENIISFCTEWEGSVQWVGQSPFRKNHKRKNWFVGIAVYDIPKQNNWNEKDIAYQTLKASGPGGQHVNKTESAVRATHTPTGLSVTASAERSQMMNKKEATERLKNKLLGLQIESATKKEQEQWMNHNTLERGNAVKIFKGEME